LLAVDLPFGQAAPFGLALDHTTALAKRKITKEEGKRKFPFFLLASKRKLHRSEQGQSWLLSHP